MKSKKSDVRVAVEDRLLSWRLVIVTTVFLYSSLLHQLGELVFVFKYYGRAMRRLEVPV